MAELEYPKGMDDDAGILAYAEQAQRQSRAYRLELERAAQRNILYYLGVQWIKYDRGIRTWRPIAVERRVPRPVTNKVAPLVNQSVANLLNFRPPITYSPASGDPADVAAATVADRINAIIEKESEIERLKPMIARWLTLTGNVFLVNNYDQDTAYGSEFIQAEECMDCGAQAMPAETQAAAEQAGMPAGLGACPQCGSPRLVPAMEQETQTPVGVTYPYGRFKTEVETLFTTMFDHASGPSIYDSPFFMTIRHRSKEWVTKMYGADVAEKVAYGGPSEPFSGLFESLAYATTLWGYNYGTPSGQSEPRVVVRRLWIQPRQDRAPQGIYAVLVGEQIVERKPWPYHDETGKPMLNVVHIGFDEIPGRTLYKSRVDDIIPKQDQRNRVESIVELHSIRSANSVWLTPAGVGMSKPTGEQGQVITYNALQGIPPPQRVPGDQVSPYLIQWLGIIDQEMGDIFGLSEVGRGEAPRGVSAYSALQLLDERSQQGQAAIMRNWALAWLEWSKQNLAIWREYAKDDRYAVTGAGQWSIEKFNKAALTGGVNLTVEVGTWRPQTMIAKRALFEQLLRLGVVNPADPMQRYELATVMGASEMMPDFKADMEHTARRIDALMQGQEVNPPAPWENHQLAISVFRRLFLSEKFEALPPPLQQRIVMFANLHFEFLRQMQGQQPMQRGSITPGPEGPGNRGVGKGAQNQGGEQRAIEQERQGAAPPQPGEGG